MTVRALRSFQGIASATAKVGRFRTGAPTLFHFIRNTVPAPKALPNDPYLQRVEPAGSYMIERPASFDEGRSPKWESAQLRFENPLVLPWGSADSYASADNWKTVLSHAFGARTGESLTLAILARGFDAVITVDESGESSEVVSFAQVARQWRLDFSDSRGCTRERVIGPVKVAYSVRNDGEGSPEIEIVHLETKYRERRKGCGLDALKLVLDQAALAGAVVVAKPHAGSPVHALLAASGFALEQESGDQQCVAIYDCRTPEWTDRSTMAVRQAI